MDIVNTEKIVRAILFTFPESRDSDDLLYSKVIRNYGAEGYSVEEFLAHRSELNVPPFETVRRTRQKLQAAYPDLRGKRYVEKKRKELEKEYKTYALKE